MVDTAVNLSPPSLVPPFANFVIASKLYSVNNPKFWIHDCKSFCTDFVISSRPDQKRLCLFTSKTSSEVVMLVFGLFVPKCYFIE